MGGDEQTTFAAQLRQLLAEKDVSVRQLAQRYNPKAPDSSGRPYLQKLLASKHQPSRKTRGRIALALGVPADYFEPDDKEPEDEVGADVGVAA